MEDIDVPLVHLLVGNGWELSFLPGVRVYSKGDGDQRTGIREPGPVAWEKRKLDQDRVRHTMSSSMSYRVGGGEKGEAAGAPHSLEQRRG